MKFLNRNNLCLLIVIFYTFLQSFHCGSTAKIQNSNTINVNYQKILLQPLKGWENITSSNYWPGKKNIDDLLIQYIQQVWKSLYTEFRLCEKYGFYRMVDSTELNTVEISLKILSSEIRNDTLSIPIIISTYQKGVNKRYSFEVNAVGILPGRSDSSEQLSAQDLVAVFDDYKRRFPYKEVVAPYYLHENNIK